MKTIATSCLVTLVALCVIGCDAATPSAERDQQKKTTELMNEANRQIGMPAIVNFQERTLAKMIAELRDQEDLICYAYIVNHMTGELVFIGKCIGFGLPYSVQFTSPAKLIWKRASGWHKMPQAEANGLYMPDGLSATWLMMVDPKSGDPRPVYIEPQIVVSPFPLT